MAKNVVAMRVFSGVANYYFCSGDYVGAERILEQAGLTGPAEYGNWSLIAQANLLKAKATLRLHGYEVEE